MADEKTDEGAVPGLDELRALIEGDASPEGPPDDAGETDDAGQGEGGPDGEDVPGDDGDDDASARDDGGDDGEPEGGPEDAPDPAREQRVARLVGRVRDLDRENVSLRRQLKELQSRRPAGPSSDLAEDFGVDRVSALRGFLKEAFGDRAEEELSGLREDLLWELAAAGQNPDVDPQAATDHRIRRLEADLRRGKVEAERARRRAEEERARAAAESQAQERARHIGELVRSAEKEVPFLAARTDAAGLVAREYELQLQQNGPPASRDEAVALVRQISRALDSYFRDEAERYRPLLGAAPAASDQKRAGRGSGRKTLTNRGASSAPARKKGADPAPGDFEAFLRSKGL